MASASFLWSSFLGGEWSPFAQGRVDLPKYKTALARCLNAYPIEAGCCPRRPGFQHAATTRNGAPGRLLPFNFSEQAAYKIEFTDGHMRFFNGPNLVSDGHDFDISAGSITTATPAVLNVGVTTNPHQWLTGDQIAFTYHDAAATKLVPYLANRQFSVVNIDGATYALYDPVTGAAIDGSKIAWQAANISVSRVLDIVTPYASGSWASARMVQTDKNAVVLQGATQPQVLTATLPPNGTVPASFTFSPAYFIDGPYLDPVNGSLATPSGTSGSVTLTLSYQVYSAITAYKTGDFVSSSGIGYISLVDANVGNTPASNPSDWAVATPGQAVSPNGFVSTDIGRLVRLYNPAAPIPWSSGTTYNAGDLALFTDSVIYQSLLGGNLNQTPSDTSAYWTPFTPGWTWGKITSLSSAGLISGTLSGSANFTFAVGKSTNAGYADLGGVAALFDGTVSKPDGSAAKWYYTYASFDPLVGTTTVFAGKNYSGASSQVITSAVIYPSATSGFLTGNEAGINLANVVITVKGNATLPTTTGQGTTIGTATVPWNQTSPVTIQSTSGASWAYVWVELAFTYTFSGAAFPPTVISYLDQVQFYGTGGVTGSQVTISILGPPLPSTASCVWRLGAYSNTTGWPTCGCYKDGRLWLAGAIPNRVDSSNSNLPFTFSPTNNAGVVGDGNSISGIFNSEEVNPIFWLQPNLQGIVAGTQEGEYLIQTGSSNVGMTPANTKADLVTSYGCANVEPKKTGLTTVFVQKYGRKVQEYLSDIFSGRFYSPNASQNAQHLTKGGVLELAYEDGLENIVWARTGLGKLIGCTYNRITLSSTAEPLYQGWHQHSLGSGQTVDSICVGPSDGGELKSLAIVAHDSSNVYHVQIARPLFDEEAGMTDAWFLDDAVVPVCGLTTTVNGITGLTFHGLKYLKGKQVDIFCAGLDLGTWTVGLDSVFVPYGKDPAGLFTQRYLAELTQEGNNYGDMACSIDGGLLTVPVVIGFSYTTQVQLVRPNDPAQVGGQNGPGFGKFQRIAQYAIQLWSSQGLSIGTSFSRLHPVKLRTEGQKNIGADQLFSGIVQDTLDDTNSVQGSQLCWQVTRPFPATVTAIGGFINTSDK